MTDTEIDALWLAHRDAEDMRAFGRAVADAAYKKVITHCSARPAKLEKVFRGDYCTGAADEAFACADEVKKFRSER